VALFADSRAITQAAGHWLPMLYAAIDSTQDVTSSRNTLDIREHSMYSSAYLISADTLKPSNRELTNDIFKQLESITISTIS